jgi:hypothetical protein
LDIRIRRLRRGDVRLWRSVVVCRSRDFWLPVAARISGDISKILQPRWQFAGASLIGRIVRKAVTSRERAVVSVVADWIFSLTRRAIVVGLHA